MRVTIASYDQDFEEFTEKTRSVNFFPGLQEELDRFIAMLPGAHVLDVGFGSGRDTLYFARAGLIASGIELTLNFIRSLRRITTSPLCCADMRKLCFCNRAFDGIWCCASILHLDRTDASSALREFSRVLRLGGALYVSVKEGEGDEWIQEGHIATPRYFTYYSLEGISDLIRDAGFEITHSQAKPHQAGRRSWLSIFARKTHDK